MTPTPVTIKGAELAFKPISGSPKDTCPTQRQVAEHNSRLDTIKAGKPVVYKAPCDVDKEKEAKTSSEAAFLSPVKNDFFHWV